VKASEQVRERTLKFLMELIGVPSTRGNEGPAAKLTQAWVKDYTDACTLVPMEDSLQDDPDYAFKLPGFHYTDQANVECLIKGRGESQPLIFNAHLDVVPPSEGQEHPFEPRFENGRIFGRGACDDKGQVATLFTLAQLLREGGVRPPGDVIFHFVVEEENGGNGTLAMVRRGVNARAVVICESTALEIVPAVRGAVWFELTTYGRAAHSGTSTGAMRISALDKAFEATQILRRLHDRILAESHGMPLFDVYEDPMPLTVGQCEAGTWPATIPAKATMKGLLGFLPNYNRRQVKQMMRQAILDEGDEWLRTHFEITFPMLNNDGNSIPTDHPLVMKLRAALAGRGLPQTVRALTAACDAWQYCNQPGIPTVVFGPGSLGFAHSKDEQIGLDEIMTGAEVLYDFVMKED
jgi:acetylornithine deacetylase